MRTPLIAANWKMYHEPEKAAFVADALLKQVKDAKEREILLCPATASLSAVADVVKGSNILLGGQNLYPMAEGAYTGETSPPMLLALGCTHVILGHSERRQYFKEGDTFIHQKLMAALEFKLTPVLCIGESLEERERNLTFDKLSFQIEEAYKGVKQGTIAETVIAYEPIWAIGTGKTATPEQAEEVHKFIRHKLKVAFGEEASEKTRVLYGGSVKPANVDTLMGQENIDGVLVGGASLEADSFARIVNFE